MSEVAMVKIFLGQRETWLYRQVVAVKWFEIISKYGWKVDHFNVCALYNYETEHN